MNRIDAAFQKIRLKNEKALVGFVTAGDPDISTSRAVIDEMLEGGIDILELGVPFSDPTADGPYIQRSSMRALKAGINIQKILLLVEKIRMKSECPIILFSYYNPLLAYGIEKLHKDAVKAGADGFLIVDLPFDESSELTSCWPDKALCVIRLIAPTTPEARMKKIAENAEGFLYLVSRTGVTGSGQIEINEVSTLLTRIKKFTEIPVCVGFGISKPEQVSQLSAIADGVVVGSAFEKMIEDNIDRKDLASLLGNFARELKGSTRL